MVKELDRFDRKILDCLSTDARMSLTELSQRVGLSKNPVALRVKALEQAGIIVGYRAILSTQRLGLSHVSFVEVKLDDTRDAALKKFNDAVKNVPEIAECHMIAGNFDYLLKVRTGSMEAYREVMGRRISSLPHVQATSTFVVMEAVVEQTNPPLPEALD
ncbi:Lrp/AsnC family transcriptional regulator [Celeribacter halophilus]|jgi:Lrp/AsnC family leucine-responsive transcriptional regulator|uniref:Lrp/AsnC ligand binding domain-containing protein n=1 Tax=Celeribacter halophilus TaxID=576117 RepID=A0AAW7XXM9_9RHOB|nr:Lrp/AsnC ligand binding domain-containing protein [Celeribacter halophilus]MBU2888631.1 Lrp/AsnC ligand binding domain-containing protein [Celeribacter halophilus]MDO6457365.1 Lrp/AsnC ligand binding domain-containing protein [Celeribacter halophilus]MDO6509014.1 Lrp/AsnC ligand binding domain-containing protein [Celeribacter halophilus]MDO6722182.1 Lrp/AsnC ligand binding domain-containing protein [Celeribacter halophilus]